MAEITSVNGTHTATEGDKKRKSHPSPLPEGPGSVALTTEPKRPKTGDITEGSLPQKNTEVTQVEFNNTLASILQVALDYDSHSVLTTVVPTSVNGETVEHSIAIIRSKLADAQYTNVFAFKVKVLNHLTLLDCCS
jgi:hypothetical protein